MISRRDISLVAKELAATGGRRNPEAIIERDYVLAWFLSCLAKHPLRERLAFKGGTALRLCWFEGYRFSEDMDFTLTGPMAIGDILASLREVHADIESASGVRFRFDREARRQGRNNHAFHLRYQGPLPAGGGVKVDITVNEKICFPLVDRPVIRQYEQFDDLPRGPTVRTYSLDEIVVEKLAALSDRARNEPRDLYDLWYLLDRGEFWLPGMQSELEEKLAFRGRPINLRPEGYRLEGGPPTPSLGAAPRPTGRRAAAIRQGIPGCAQGAECGRVKSLPRPPGPFPRPAPAATMTVCDVLDLRYAPGDTVYFDPPHTRQYAAY